MISKKFKYPTIWWFQDHQKKIGFKLSQLYLYIGITKQAVFNGRKRFKAFQIELSDLVEQVDLIREEHPGCGVEKMYHILQPKHLGRDKFCEIFMDLGYRVRTMKNYVRTTIPSHINYPNLIQGIELNKPYQVVQSDITYFNLLNSPLISPSPINTMASMP